LPLRWIVLWWPEKWQNKDIGFVGVSRAPVDFWLDLLRR
jgi:hypothetical protein